MHTIAPRLIFTAISVCICVICTAQDDYYSDDDYYYSSSDDYYSDSYEYVPCLHSGDIEFYSIVRYREGLQKWEQSVAIHGTVMMSNTCIDIQGGRIEMQFVIREIEKKSNQPRYYRFYRENADDICDFMELREGIGRDRGLLYLMFGNLDREKDVMTNTQQIVVKRIKGKVL